MFLHLTEERSEVLQLCFGVDEGRAVRSVAYDGVQAGDWSTQVLTKALQKVLHVPFPEPREIAALNVDLTEIEPVERRVGGGTW